MGFQINQMNKIPLLILIISKYITRMHYMNSCPHYHYRLKCNKIMRQILVPFNLIKTSGALISESFKHLIPITI